jgi:putative RNA 2'-phosphotransferase
LTWTSRATSRSPSRSSSAQLADAGGGPLSSKLLSLVLRHRPDLVGIRLDEAGWVEVDELLAGLAALGKPMTRTQLERIVATSDKQRFALDGDRIRASQGHSVPVDLGLVPVAPPAVLFHGTPERNVEAILREGLRRGTRHHVHLSPDEATAVRVGARRGRPRVLEVDAAAMAADGHVFLRSANGVWLVDAVPPAYLRLTP